LEEGEDARAAGSTGGVSGACRRGVKGKRWEGKGKGRGRKLRCLYHEEPFTGHEEARHHARQTILQSHASRQSISIVLN
jgi:hypothetical protein